MLWPCSSEIDDGLSLAGQYAGRGLNPRNNRSMRIVPLYRNVPCSGLGIGLMFLPAVIAVSCYFERRRALATGVAVCGAGVGCFIFAPAGNFMLDVLDWKNSMFIIAAITAQGAVLGMLFRPLPDAPPINDSSENNNPDNRWSKSSSLLGRVARMSCV